MGSVSNPENPSKEAKPVEEVDRISNLPDSILCHILSFLPTKFAVATTILSTKWKYLFTPLLDLDFDDSLLLHPQQDNETQVDCMSFMTFVDRVLTLCDAPHINRFRLKCGDHNIFRVNAWISAAVLQKLRELDLCISVAGFVLQPDKLLNCETLVVLKLGAKIVLKVPEEVCLPSLKIIHLDRIIFADDELIGGLLSGCPVLEDLTILGCVCYSFTCNIVAPALKSLTIDSLVKNGICTNLFKFAIVIDAPHLLYLKYFGLLPTEFFVKNLKSLVEAHLDFKKEYVVNEQVANAILEGISGVQFLHLSGDSMEAFGYSFRSHLPTFHKLTHLELGVNHRVGWKSLPCLLKCVPFLETLVFVEGLLDHKREHHDTKMSPKEAPSCLLFRLKAIEIRYYQGTIRELNMVKYFLKNARVLENLTVHTYGMAERRLLKVRERILALPRGSLMCQQYKGPENTTSKTMDSNSKYVVTVRKRKFDQCHKNVRLKVFDTRKDRISS